MSRVPLVHLAVMENIELETLSVLCSTLSDPRALGLRREMEELKKQMIPKMTIDGACIFITAPGVRVIFDVYGYRDEHENLEQAFEEAKTELKLMFTGPHQNDLPVIIDKLNGITIIGHDETYQIEVPNEVAFPAFLQLVKNILSF